MHCSSEGLKQRGLVSGDPTKSRIVALQGLEELKHDRIERHELSLILDPGSPQTWSDISEVPPPNEEVLSKALSAKMQAHIFAAFPSWVIKLPELELMDRSTAADYIVWKELSNLTKEIRQREVDVFSGPTARLDATISKYMKDVSKFAVLSHTWGRGEPNHKHFVEKRSHTTSKGYRKLKDFCQIAHKEHGVEFAWADTVCIDKRNNSELDEAIRSMFRWYRGSSICIIYLADTDTLDDFPFDLWFTRGWTLQELLAPLRIKFYTKSWQPLTDLPNEKLDPSGVHEGHLDYVLYNSLDEKHLHQLKLLGDGISAATGISMDHVYNFQPGLHSPPLPERMKWIAQRVTTRPEDISYSMMGVLGVSISVVYGEGAERAFFRLFQAALEVDWSPGWFLWVGRHIESHIHPSRMIPSSPACYLFWDYNWHIEGSSKKLPVTLTNCGLQINVLVVPTEATYPELPPDSSSMQEGTATITCGLFSDAISVHIPAVDLQFQHPEFAFGILDYDFWPPIPRRINAILLHRTSRRRDSSRRTTGNFAQVQERVVYDGWERLGKGTISLSLQNELYKENMTSDVEWLTLLRTKVPQIAFRTLYL